MALELRKHSQSVTQAAASSYSHTLLETFPITKSVTAILSGLVRAGLSATDFYFPLTLSADSCRRSTTSIKYCARCSLLVTVFTGP